MPSCKALRTAHTESSTRSNFSFCSTSLLAPTYIHPIAPARLATLSFIKSLSLLIVMFFCCSLSSSILFSVASLMSASLINTLESLPTIILSTCPRSFMFIKLKSSPVCSENIFAPTANAISCISS